MKGGALVTCSAYLGMSLDGFIAGPNDELDWLEQVDPVDGEDFGYADFMASVDALVMGRRTFEVITAMDIAWPYTKPVVVMSRSPLEIPEGVSDCEVFTGSPAEVVAVAEQRGWSKLYIDGGQLVSSFIADGLLDELTVSILPVALGGGVPLFGTLPQHHWFAHRSTNTFANGMVQLGFATKNSTAER